MSLIKMRDELAKVVGCRAITIVSETIPKFTGGKKNKYTGRVSKRSEVNGMINWIYENAVNNQRDREGKVVDFEAEPRVWGVRLRLDGRVLPFVRHKKDVVYPHVLTSLRDLEAAPLAELYLEMKVQKSLGHHYVLDGKLVEDELTIKLIESELYQRPLSDHQGVDKPIILRDYNLCNLNQITLNGTTIVANNS